MCVSICHLVRLMAQCVPPISDKVQISITKDNLEVWMVNTGSDTVTLESGELFGFNLGTFSEKTVGRDVLKHVETMHGCFCSFLQTKPSQT